MADSEDQNQEQYNDDNYENGYSENGGEDTNGNDGQHEQHLTHNYGGEVGKVQIIY